VTTHAFVSFQTQDRWAFEALVQGARERQTPIDFVGFGHQNRLDTSWRAETTGRLLPTRGTIVLIGLTTYQSNDVLWAIEETLRLGHHLFGVQIHGDQTHVVPAGLPPQNVVRWDHDRIHDWLVAWG
jgi:hypothetical protein